MTHSIELWVNGQKHRLQVLANKTLLEILRNNLKLMGVKEGCGRGDCGTCTVLLDGIAVNSCLTLAVEANFKEILTIEGLARNNELHPLQKSFIEHGAIQCGFCTPGMILAAKALLDSNPTPTKEEVKAAIAGNLCRCTGYKKIIEAILDYKGFTPETKSNKKRMSGFPGY